MGSFLMSSSVFAVLSILIAVPSNLALVFGKAMHCSLLHIMIPWDLCHGNDGVWSHGFSVAFLAFSI